MVNINVTRVEHSWAGLRTFAPDRVPVVGYDPRVSGFFWLAGQGGYGIETSPALSIIAATLLTGKDLSPEYKELSTLMKPDRFIN
jgi:D-arginine dehydrogenase